MASGTAAKESASNKGARRRIRLFLIVVCCFTCWATLTLWKQGDSVDQKQAELTELQDRLTELKGTNEQYKAEVTRLHDSEYIEQKVRKDYGMIRPGDTIFGR
ncbi:FtsB family cell division protein [Paenibacillus alkalitolerans]|uniref:FtsB family cell division protein n=1 Tax=Paenibacillus alkalitolerans TaxID=2799335 RepID=UPI0018F60A00|nr:septum formation initiator family protein [Paenibacillus alkalitolerans]